MLWESLTAEEKRVYLFMKASEKENGMIIVPPWMKGIAEEVEKRLKNEKHKN